MIVDDNWWRGEVNKMDSMKVHVTSRIEDEDGDENMIKCMKMMNK